MFTFSRLGKKGNLGNQLFQIAATIGLAKMNNDSYSFPAWQYQPFFKNKLPLCDAFQGFDFREERFYEFHDWNFEHKNHDLSGWFQTEKYFDSELTRHYLEFNDDIVQKIRQKYKPAFEKRTILLSIRRGDFVHHQDYFQLPIKYYLNSLANFFPDFEASNLIVLSDDINYCKFHFSFLENAYFGEGLNAIEQLCLGSLCDDFIIGNSTFSWWSAWLGEKKDSKIIRPLKNFDGQKSIELNDRDYFPERWVLYNHLDDKISLPGMAFCLSSAESVSTVGKYVRDFFDAEVVISGSEKTEWNYHFKSDYFLPPVLIYYSFLKSKNDKQKWIINNTQKVFGVSKALNYKEFLIDNDFGFFSRIFSFSYSNKTHAPIFIAYKGSKQTNPERIVINCTAGKFYKFGGYTFSFYRFLKRMEIWVKSTIKNILSIQKNG